MRRRGLRDGGRLVLGAAGLALVIPTIAWGAVAEPRLGEQADPVGDSTFAYDDDYANPTRLVDVTKVRVDFDDRHGELNLRFEGDGLVNQTHSAISFSATLSAPDASNRCNGSSDNAVTVQAGGGRGYDATEPAYLTRGGDRILEGFTEWPGDGSRPRIAFKSPYLQGQDYRCVSGVSATRGVSGYQTSSRDNVKPFCLGGCPAGDAPGNLRVSGSTLAWNAVESTSTYVVATSTAPEGAPGRTTTYKTVTGTTYTPPAVPGATRYYGVRVNAAGAPWAAPEVSIAYPTAVPVLSRSGTTVKWTKVGSHTAYVLATSTAPEGAAGRTTTHRTVTGLSSTPPAAPGKTRYYGVRVNVAGATWATPEIAIAYP